MSFSYRGEIKELDDNERVNLHGSFISLSNGITHYELGNPESEETVVLVHGFSAPSFIFEPTFNFLQQSGFRVLRYDLFGRGLSDRPNLRYSIDLYDRQLLDLLDALRITTPFNLLGLSMGGPITVTFTTRHPERVKSLTLIDPAGARQITGGLLSVARKVPLIPEAILSLAGNEGIIKDTAKDFFDPKLVEHFQKQYAVQMQYKGFKRAILSSIRNGMLDSFLDSYKQVGASGKPVLLFFGQNDHTVPFEHSKDLCAVMPQVEFHVIEGCGHIPHYEKPEEVNPILLKFLRQ